MFVHWTNFSKINFCETIEANAKLENNIVVLAQYSYLAFSVRITVNNTWNEYNLKSIYLHVCFAIMALTKQTWAKQ